MKSRRLVVVGVAAALVATATVIVWPKAELTPAAPVAQAPDERTALIAAQRQGTQVEVTGLTTESSRFFANPSGTMTMKQSLVPERVKRDGAWVDIDPTLVQRQDGRYEPKATAPGIVFSGGGTQPFARMGVGDWEIALSWPRALPAPQVAGDTATYPEVLPGVDLRARVGREGFGHELVVKTKEAAADPALAKITFGLQVKGVALKTDQGALTATNAKGETVFSAPAATMWDSGEKKSAVGVAITDKTLTLTPDLGLLTSPEAKLPITIDPQYSYLGVRQNGWGLVRSGWPDQTHWNMAPEDQRARDTGVARVGKSPEDGNGSIDRTMVKFDTSPLKGTVVNAAQLNIKQGWKWAHTCDANQVPWLDLFLIDEVGPGVTWRNQPNWFWENHVGSQRPTAKLGQPCGPNWIGWNIKHWAQKGADHHWSTLTFLLKDRDENNVNGWKRFYVQTEPNGLESYPFIDVEYNHYPGDAYEDSTVPVHNPCRHCGGKSYMPGDHVTLKARLADADGGSLHGNFEIFGPGGGFRYAGKQHSGTMFSTDFPIFDKADGDTYSWTAWAGDDALESRGRPRFREFAVDRNGPAAAPIVDSALYVPDNDWHGGPGVPGKFTFKPNGVTDVDHYLYSFSQPAHKPVYPDVLGGPASIDIPPDKGGPVTLFVQSVDRAGNPSPEARYSFNVRPGLGPKALWPLDAHTRDEAELGDRDATLHGGATWTEAGAVGSAVQLDGTTGFLSAPNTVRTDTSFTASAWVKLSPDHTGRLATAVSQLGGGASPGFRLSYSDDNRWTFSLPKGPGDLATDMAVSPVGMPQPGAWTHLAGVYDATVGAIRLYVNGSLAGSAQRTTSPWHAPGEVRIGDAGPAGQRWKGALDEVRVYDRALVGNDVRGIVGLGNVQVGQWKFDESDGTDARSNIPGGTPMKLEGGARFVPGPVGNAVQFDGGDDVARTGESVLRTDQSFSVSAWVKMDRAVQAPDAFTAVSQDGEKRSGFLLGHRNVGDSLRWELHAAGATDADSWGTLTRSSMPAQVGVWTHLTGVFDREGQQIKLYVNGVLAGTSPWTSHASSSGSLVVGRGKWDNSLCNYWPGAVDEVRAYTRVLDEAEIRGIIAADAVATGSWKLDGTATDDSGSGRHGTITGNPTWVPGQSTTPNPDDLAVRLDGVDDHITAPTTVDTSRSYAVSAWLKPDAVNVVQTAVHQGFSLHTTADGKFAFTAMTAGNQPVTASGGSVQVGIWRHVAAVHDAERREISLYVNGVVVGATPFANPATSTAQLRIGRSASAEFFRGAIDDVRVYPRGLFEDEIRTIAGFELALAHNLKLDDTAGDSVGNRGGTVHGGATFGPGRSGNALKLDGVDDAVSTTGIDLRTDQSFTVTAWVNLRKEDNGEVTAVSLDAGQGSKFRLGHVKDGYDNTFGAWVFEMPEQNGRITKAALSVEKVEIGENVWTHLTGVYDAKARTIRLYVNGMRVGDGTLLAPWTDGVAGLQLGRSKHNNAYSRHWLGRIDDVRVYTGGLTGDRIAELIKSYGA